MRILNLDAEKTSEGFVIEALLDKNEFKKLKGEIDDLILFSADTIIEKTKAIKTGARHNHARYFLVPVSLRREFDTDTRDFDNIKCSCIENKGRLYVIFCLEGKGVVKR